MGKKKQINALDLFSGAGGFSHGLRSAGFNIIAAIEFNAQVAKTYEYNHPDTKMFVDDIRNISADEIENLFKSHQLNCDVIFGGPPCQGFSMAGNRIRSNNSFLEDERNYLFKEYIRMVNKLQPMVFILENVPGILNYNNGDVKEDCDDTGRKLGEHFAGAVKA